MGFGTSNADKSAVLMCLTDVAAAYSDIELSVAL
jgi:hypothetical protein